MIAAIMQPYFFPYIGYVQLMRAVDVFVLYDDAQYMKGGWINRNRIAVDGRPGWLTLPVRRDSIALPINRRDYGLGEPVETVKRQLAAAYRRAPAYREASRTIDALLDCLDANVAGYNANLLQGVARDLGIGCAIVASSSLGGDGGLRGEDRVIDLCRRVGATRYVNAIGGTGLYDADRFARDGLALAFLRTRAPPEELKDGPAQLSIVHWLMAHGLQATRTAMDAFDVLDPRAAVAVA